MKRWCWYCIHRGDRFRLPGNQGHVMCEHPEPVIAGEPGWDTLRAAFDNCPEWQAESNQQPTFTSTGEG